MLELLLTAIGPAGVGAFGGLCLGFVLGRTVRRRNDDNFPPYMAVFLAATLFLSTSGCATTTLPPPPEPTPRPTLTQDHLILSPDMAVGLPYWRLEIENAGLKNPFIIMVHGGDGGTRWLYRGTPETVPGEMQKLAAWVRYLVPMDRPLVIISCNPGGYVLKLPNTYQAVQMVWIIPGFDIARTPGGALMKGAGTFEELIKCPYSMDSRGWVWRLPWGST
jgi:hypothetical protein